MAYRCAAREFGAARGGPRAREVQAGSTGCARCASGYLRPPLGRRVKSLMSPAETRSAAEESDVSIVPMTEHDLLEVVEIEEASGLSRWGWAAYYAELQGGNRDLLLVAKPLHVRGSEPHQIVGYIVARETAGELHINNVAVRDQ